MVVLFIAFSLSQTGGETGPRPATVTTILLLLVGCLG